MKIYIFKFRNIAFLAILLSIISCEGRRDFPELQETSVNLDNFDIILLVSGDTQDVTATFEPNIAPNRDYLRVISGAPVDITAQSTITVNREYSGGADGAEGSLKLIDGDLDTKYLSGYVAPFWVNLEFDEPIVAGYYAFTSGNDAPSRDPRDWEIQGSQDGVTWETLDTRSEYSFPDRKLTREFYFENNTAYKYYRFDVLSNNG